MPRRNRSCPEINAFHIYARANNRLSFGISSEKLWEIYSNYLFFIHHAFNVKIHCFTLMTNHFHLLCSFPMQNISETMQYFMRETSKTINSERKSINHVYGGRYKSTLITIPHHFAIAYRYVLQNPLRAGITKNILNYSYTSLPGIFSIKKEIIPITPHYNGLDILIPDSHEEYLKWLHDLFNEEEIEKINLAISKRKFTFPKNRNDGKALVI